MTRGSVGRVRAACSRRPLRSHLSAGLPLGLLAAALALGLLAFGARAAVADEVDELLNDALAALQQGDFDGAKARAAEATSRGPGRGQAWAVSGYVRSKAGDPAGGIEAYREAVRLAPADAVAHNNLGALLIARGEAKAGLAEVQQALALEPAYADARNNLGAALERLGRASEARQAYETVAERAPRHATALTNLGTLRWRAGDVSGAQSAWRRAQTLDPQLAEAGLNLALTAGGDASEALARLEQEAARPGAPVSVRVQALRAGAATHARARRWVEARGLLEAAQRLAPWDARVLNDLAVTEDQLGLDRDALSHLDAALKLEPGLNVARNNLGIVQVHAGALDAASETFEDLLLRDPRFHRAHFNLGVLHASQGRLPEARRHFEAAQRLAPRDGAVRYNLGLLRRSGGGDAAAERRDYEEALALDPSLGEAHLALGTLLADPSTPLALRDEAQAVTHLQRFLDLAAPSDGDGRLEARSWLQWIAEHGRSR